MKILIVEDDQVISLMLRRMLERMEHEVIDVVTRGREAVDKALNEPCELILMDIMLKDDIDGIEAYRQINKEKKIPIIYITGNSDERNKMRANKIGFHDFITKPVVYEELKSSISMLEWRAGKN